MRDAVCFCWYDSFPRLLWLSEFQMLRLRQTNLFCFSACFTSHAIRSAVQRRNLSFEVIRLPMRDAVCFCWYDSFPRLLWLSEFQMLRLRHKTNKQTNIQTNKQTESKPMRQTGPAGPVTHTVTAGTYRYRAGPYCKWSCIKDVVALLIYEPIGLWVRFNRSIDSSEDSAKCGLIGQQANKVLITY